MLNYSVNVITSYIRNFTDGTLWSLKRLNDEGESHKPLYRVETSNFLQVLPADTRPNTLEDYRALTNDPELWAAFEAARLEPCFQHVPDFHPFEIHAANDHDAMRYGEDAVSPLGIVNLSLDRIAHRFPGGEGLPADNDVRDLITAQTHVFHFNYANLNIRRLANVRSFMRITQGLQVLWTVWFLELCVGDGAFRPLHAALAVAGVNPGGANPVLAVLSNPVSFAVLTALLYFGLFRLARYVHGLQRQRFAAFTRASAATVSRSVISRQDNLVYLTRAMLEEIDRGKEAAWDGNTLKTWAGETQKWAKMVFWCDQRIEANEEHLRMHMKLAGLAYSGVRSEARFRALLLISGHLTLGAVVAIAVWIAGGLMGLHANWPTALGVGAYVAATLCFVAMLLGLHSLVKYDEAPQSLNDIVQWASTRAMKGYRDNALYREVAEFMTRDKRRLLREEEKRRAA